MKAKRMLELSNQGPPLDTAAIRNAERELDFGFPDDYRAFLLETNGGSPAESQVYHLRNHEWLRVHVFFGLEVGIESNSLHYNRQFVVGQFEFDMLPFAATDTDDVFYLAEEGAPIPGVHFCYWGDSAKGRSLSIAPSFSAFVEGLVPERSLIPHSGD